jgi:hypothetical protein
MSIHGAELDVSVARTPHDATELSVAASRFNRDVIDRDADRVDTRVQTRMMQVSAKVDCAATDAGADVRAQAEVDAWAGSAAAGYSAATVLFLTRQVSTRVKSGNLNNSRQRLKEETQFFVIDDANSKRRVVHLRQALAQCAGGLGASDCIRTGVLFQLFHG